MIPDTPVIEAGQAIICALIVTLGGVLVELIRRGNRNAKQASEHAEAARDQVQNSHGTILRDDIDGISDGVNELRAEVAKLAATLDAVQASSDIQHAALWQALGKPAETLPPPKPGPSLRKWFHDRTH